MRRPVAIVVALLLSWPQVRLLADPSVDPVGPATRFLVTLALCWLAAAAFHALVSTYATAAKARQAEAGDRKVLQESDLQLDDLDLA
jgi:hypothetical protein